MVGGTIPDHEPPDTTHLTVVDQDGNVAAITHSLGGFSGVITPGLGFIYNNAMNRFDPRPGRASSLAPGKARMHLMMPTIAFQDQRVAMVLGAPGGNAILSALVQVFTNVVEYGMNAVEAVSAPRIHAEGRTIWCEARTRTDTCEALRRRGFTVVHWLPGGAWPSWSSWGPMVVWTEDLTRGGRAGWGTLAVDLTTRFSLDDVLNHLVCFPVADG